MSSEKTVLSEKTHEEKIAESHDRLMAVIAETVPPDPVVESEIKIGLDGFELKSRAGRKLDPRKRRGTDIFSLKRSVTGVFREMLRGEIQYFCEEHPDKVMRGTFICQECKCRAKRHVEPSDKKSREKAALALKDFLYPKLQQLPSDKGKEKPTGLRVTQISSDNKSKKSLSISEDGKVV